MNSNGWISAYRQIQSHWVWQNSEYYKAWMCILFNVNHEEKNVLIGSTLFNCLPGQSLMSLDSWGKLFGGWSKWKVRRFFELLEKDNMIATENATVTTRLTVCNYCEYQNIDNAARNALSKRTATQAQRIPDTNNKPNNLNKSNKSNKKAALSFLDRNNIKYIPMETWEEWIDHKRKLKLAISDRALKRNIKEIEGIGTDNAVELVEVAVDKNWKSIFPINVNSNTSNEPLSASARASIEFDTRGR